MAATSGVAVTWVWLVLLSGAGALPLGGVPLPSDPTLSNIAPPACLWYGSYAGQGPADPNSAHETEQLFAEPQVVRFAQEIEAQITKAVRRAAGPSREGRIHAEHLPKLIKVLLTRPLAAYVEDVHLIEGGEKGVHASAAVVLSAGDCRGEVQAAIADYEKLIPADKPQLTTEEVAGLQWRRVPTPPEAPVVRFGWKDDYFIIAIGDQTPQKLVDRMSGAAPEWLVRLREEHPVARELSLGYVNLQGILNLVRPHIEGKDPKNWLTLEKLGLTDLIAVHAVTGFDDVGCTSDMHLVTKDGNRPGLLGLLPHRPLAAGDLTPIPKDALFAFAASVGAQELFDHAAKLASSLDPHVEESLERNLWAIENRLGVNVRDDILASLGDAAVLYVPAGDLVISWLNSAGAVKVKDAEKLSAAIDKLVKAARVEMARGQQEVAIVESEIDGRRLFSLQFARPMPISPSWCVGEDWLIISLSPQAVRAALDRQTDDSLADAVGVVDSIGVEGGVSIIAYQDTPRLVRSLYPWINMGVQMASGELRRQGVEFDLMALPAEDVIAKHLLPSVATMAKRDDGFHFNSQSSLPGGGNLAAAAPIGVALLMPAVHSARTAARQAQDMNNMRQIALAMHNYHDSHKSFPTDIYSKDGKPLLSWRVQLLPYLEQTTQYEQFNRDEPWDSAHNRKLLAHMPAVFRSAEGGDVAKTPFLAIKGPDTVMPGNERLSFKHITDGSSNTLMFVKSAPDAAIEWTKPADIEFNADKPLAGVASPSGAFLIAFCDGSVRQLSLAIGDDAMRRLVNRHDGEAIDSTALSAPPAPHLYQPTEVENPAGPQ